MSGYTLEWGKNTDRLRRLLGFEDEPETEAKEAKPPCPDCNGSGQYVGFTEAGPCRTCGGHGV